MKNTSELYPGVELTALKDADNYYRAILGHFAPYLGERVVEIGAGLGTFSHLILDCASTSQLTLVEPADNLFPMLQKEFSGDTRVRLVNGCLEDIADSLSPDSVVLVNVLEHIEDDWALLRTIHGILNPGGTILLFVPALPCLYGSLDEAFGHFRRYTKSALTLRLEKMRFQIVRLQYFNLPGIGPWFLAGKVLKRRSIPPSDVRMYDRWVMPWISRLERKWEPPVGQSILAIARK